MVRNPCGYVNVTDGGAPRIITARAAENISGGNFVQYSGAADVVSSGLNSYADGDIQVVNDGSGASFAGIALHDQTSGTAAYVSVATDATLPPSSLYLTLSSALSTYRETSPVSGVVGSVCFLITIFHIGIYYL